MNSESEIDQIQSHFVADSGAFQEACDRLGSAERFAFDAEFVAEDGYRPHLCLIQAATKHDVWIIDPLGDFDTSRFWEFVADPAIETVVHAGTEDLTICFQQTDSVPQNIFDIQVAAGLVSTDYPMSLQRLARSILGARLHKSQTLTNWRQRPLTPSQMKYAIEDVAYVLRIHEHLCTKLTEKGRREWAIEEFARFSDPESYRQETQDPLRRVRGVGTLNRKGLAIAHELAMERDAIAREFNRPPRAILKDHLIVEIARHRWTQTKDIQSLRGLQLRGKSVERLAVAVQRGLDTPPDNRPPLANVDADTPDEVTISRIVSAVLNDFCQVHSVASQLLANNKDIRALVRSHTRDSESGLPRALQRGWRRRAVGSLVDEVLDGRRSVRIVRNDGRFCLDVDQVGKET